MNDMQSENTPPLVRRVIQAPILADAAEVPEASDDVLIKAKPSATGDQCVLQVNRVILAGHSWYFPSFESAAGSPLIQSLFSLADIETVLVMEATICITRKDKSILNWKPLATETGQAVREFLKSGQQPLAQNIIDNMPAEETIREGIQKVIDTEVNPGVAGHGGNISLLGVRGNTVTIQMGGGCQGCSAADLTLKQGIHTAFRKAVPEVGAILDETDHGAGLNPYFS